MTTELTTDPRTELDIVDVPGEYMKYFAELKGAVIHWFGAVEKYSRNWRPETRIAIVSDQCVYVCRPDGDIVRCLNIRFVQELLISEQMAIGFKVGAPERDLLIVLPTQPERDVVAKIVGKVYYNLVGHKLKMRTLTGDAADSLQQTIRLEKPAGWGLKVEPIRSIKSLTKMMLDKQRKEEEERRLVELQFHKIEDGLRIELQQYRAEEQNRLVQQLSEYAKQLERKEEEIQRIKDTSISREDKEMWRHCPNCVDLRRVLDTNQNEEKQKILRLEKQIDSQNHIVQHLQIAIQYRTAAAKEAAELGGSEESKRVHGALQAEIATAQRKNRELQQLILESPYLTPDVKARAVRLGGEGGAGGGSGVAGAMMAHSGVAVNSDLQDLVGEKEREIRYLKQVLTEATQKQVSEMALVKKLLQKYDAQVVLYLERVFREQAQMAGLDARRLAESASVTAMRKAQDAADAHSVQRQQMENQAALLPRGFTAVVPSSGAAAAAAASPGRGASNTPSRTPPNGTPSVNPLSASLGGGASTPGTGAGTPRSPGLLVAARSAATRSPHQLH